MSESLISKYTINMQLLTFFSAKNGKLIQYGNDEKSKHSLKIIGTKYVFSINNPQAEDAGFYQVDVDEANVLTTDFQGNFKKSIQAECAGIIHQGSFQMNYLTPNPSFFPLQVPAVQFAEKLKDVKAVETEDAIFQCVLSTPLNSITWSKEDSSLESGDKYEISVSEDRLTHTLRVKDCEVTDAGRYYAIAGLTSSCASLAVKGE